MKALPLDNAIIYWEMLFNKPGMEWKTLGPNSSTIDWLALWTGFLQSKWTKSVNKDMWNQTFEFYRKTLEDPTLGFWSEDGAWPGVIDDFVAYAKQKIHWGSPEEMETD